MTPARAASLALVTLLATSAARPSSAQDPSSSAQDPTRGSVRIGTEAVEFGPPLALWDLDEGFLSLGFFTAPPSPRAEAEAREAGVWQPPATGQAVLLDLEFQAGQSNAMLENLTTCRLEAHGFPREIALDGQAADCHILSVGGLLRPGGGVIGLIQGEGEGYAIRLPFSAWFPMPTAAAPSPEPPLPPNTVVGSATYDGRDVEVTEGLAWWVAERHEVRLALFDRVPASGMLADLRAGSWGEGGPLIQVHLEITPGSPPGPGSVGYCYVNTSFPESVNVSTNTDARGCGLAALEGDFRPGGRVAVRLEGQGPGPGEKPVSWTVRAHLPIAQ